MSKLILFGESSLRRVLTEYVAHFHTERNHPGKGNVLLFPEPNDQNDQDGRERRVRCRKRLGVCSVITTGPHEYFYLTG